MVRVRYSFGSRHTGRIGNIKKQRGKYPDVMRKVVRISDIVLEILDARFVDEMRNAEVEEDVLKNGKVLVYVLNKVDLVSRRDIEKRLAKDVKPFVFISATKGIGLAKLKARIKMESKKILKVGDRKRVHVGVIGYPNAGKSSVINMITKRGVASVGKQAGFTKGTQKIRMSEGILILDTPGVIPKSEYSSGVRSFARDVKVGARTYSDVKNPEDAVAYLMVKEIKPRTSTDEYGRDFEVTDDGRKIAEFYGIGANGNVDGFIEELGKKKGFLGKGGVVDVDRTARLILRDWQEGRIGVRG